MFSDKVVLITGASSGIGAETAVHFAKLEAQLVITGRNSDNLNKVCKDCEENSPKMLKPLVILADLNKETEVVKLVHTILENFKKIDVLVNNAGIMDAGSIENTSLEQFDRIMETNVRVPYYLTMLVVPHLIETKGNIINVSSLAGLRSWANILSYCISKAALDQFTKCVAVELAPKGVRVNAVNPGVIVTGIHLKGTMTEAEYEAFLEMSSSSHDLARPGEAKDVASVITFLASDAASKISGATLPVDGGRHAMCPVD